MIKKESTKNSINYKKEREKHITATKIGLAFVLSSMIVVPIFKIVFSMFSVKILNEQLVFSIIQATYIGVSIACAIYHFVKYIYYCHKFRKRLQSYK